MTSFAATLILSMLFVCILTPNASALATETDYDWSVELATRVLRQVPGGPENQNRVAATTRRLLRTLRTRPTCRPSVCIAIESSSFIKPRHYRLAKMASQLAIAITSTDEEARMAAVQFALTTTPVMPLTANRTQVFQAVRQSRQSSIDRVNLSAGLAYCWFQVRSSDNSNKAVVLLGSGRSTTGFSPKIVVNAVEKAGGRIIPVVTSGLKDEFVTSIGAGLDDIVRLRSYSHLANAVNKLVYKLCDW